MTSVKSIASITLDTPPSCIELWPANRRYAVIGTYYLEKTDTQNHDQPGEINIDDVNPDGQKGRQQRTGSLVLLDIQDDKM